MSRTSPGAVVLLASCLLLSTAGGLILADEPTVKADVDVRRVGVEDTVELTVSIEGAIDLAEELGLPPLKNLRLVGGPSISTQFSFVNGVQSNAKSYTYVLQGLAPGPAEIGALRVRLKSGDKTTAPIALEIVPGRVRAERRQAEDPFESIFGRRRRAGPEPKLFVEAQVSRQRLHVGEPLVLTYFLYTRATDVSDLAFRDAPQYPGFWSEELERPATTRGEPATVEGEAYQRYAILRKLLFPTKAGQLTIPGSTLKIALRGFFGNAVVERSTKPIVVSADPLPSEPGFSGAVGSLRVSASLDRTAVPLGEAATLRFQVEGRGNLKWIERGPDVTVAGAKVYPPQQKSDLKVTPAGMEGARSWEYVLVPETAGDLEIPALPFVYFDPSTGRVVRVESARLSLHVESAAGSAPAPGATAAAPLRSRGGTLVLRSDLDLSRTTVPSLGSRGLLLGAGLVMAAHAAMLGAGLVGRRKGRRPGAPAARRSLRGTLSELERAGRGGMSKEAAAALIERALHEVFGPLDGASNGDEGEAAARGVLDEVHFLRYAPQLGDYTEKIRDVASRAAEVVRRWA
jgi:hypothetical protein